MKVATHNGRFHADDVFALATLGLAGVVTEVVRTRDATQLAQSDLRIDVGREHNPDTGDFDHHQLGGAGQRPNGIPYASFGLVWQQYGSQVAGSEAAAAIIDEVLVGPVDADDVGLDLFTSTVPPLRPYDVVRLIANFNPSWKTTPSSAEMDQLFSDAVTFATTVLEREIEKAKEKLEARSIVQKAIQSSPDPRVIILDQFVPWQETVVTEAPEALYVVFPTWPAVRSQWSVQAVTKSLNSFENRKSLPAEWAGKERAPLVQVTGVDDAVFCHSARFVVIAESKAGALKLAELALQDNPDT